MEERNLYKFGAGAGILGAAMGILLNIVHPRVTNYGAGYTEDLLTEVSESSTWVGIHAGLLFAILFVTVGFIAFARSMRDAGGYQHLAMASAVFGGAIGFATLGVDGYAMKSVADAWAAGHSEAMFAAASGVASVGWGLFMVLIFTLFGGSALFTGIAVVSGAIYPKWFGILGIIAGLASLLVGVWGIYTGPTSAWFAGYLPVSLGTTVYALVGAIYLWRHASVPAMAAKV